MAFNRPNQTYVPKTRTSPVKNNPTPDGQTFNGHVAFGRDPKSELFLLATGSFFGQDSFYETGSARSQRYVSLVHEVAVADPQWLLSFVTWLRHKANIRSAAIVAGLEGARALLRAGYKSPEASGVGLVRQLAQAGIARADEPGEAVAYWVASDTARMQKSTPAAAHLPKPVKRAVADALIRVASEFSVLKYDTPSKGFRFADLIRLTHPTPKAMWQADLFGWLLAETKGRTEVPGSLPMIKARRYLMDIPVAERPVVLGTQLFKDAGMTWEATAGWLQSAMTAEVWGRLIPDMGYMALLRNLANFDKAGVSDKVAAAVSLILADPDSVAKSKQLPFRFLTAHENVLSLRWGHALSQALDASLVNVPELPGRTLILVDTSGSMDSPYAKHAKLRLWDAAALFGIALAKRADWVDMFSYSSGWSSELKMREFPLRSGAPLLAELQTWKHNGFNMGGGTPTAAALRKAFNGHDRVVLLTDEQADYDPKGVDASIPADVPLYTFNLAGYTKGSAPSNLKRHVFGGLTDDAFRLIPMIEAAQGGLWPWEMGEN